jgi:MFS superfamily sulfate permease-like transporter
VRTLLRAPGSDVLVLIITFALTVLVDLTAAIGAGMVLAAFLFMKRMAEMAHIVRAGLAVPLAATVAEAVTIVADAG